MKNQERSDSSIRILGVDPGTLSCGFGLLEISPSNISLVTSGVISTKSSEPLYKRLNIIFQSLLHIIRTYSPDHLVVEKVFFSQNARSALSLGQARGVVLLTGALENLTLNEFTALEVKKSVTGYGRADKQQIQRTVKMILNMNQLPSTDQADALALALCYANTIKLENIIRRSQ